VNGKSKLLVPSRRLPTADIGVCLLGFLAQTCSAIRILLSDCLAVGQVLGSIDNDHQSTNLGPINGHVRKDACCVHAIDKRRVDFGLGRHHVDIVGV